MVSIVRKTVNGNRFAYVLTGDINGEDFTDEVVIKASKVSYSHASLTRIPADAGPRDVLSFHKSAAAAAKGNSSLRTYAISIRVIEIG